MRESFWGLKSLRFFLSALLLVKWTPYSVTWRRAKRQQAFPRVFLPTYMWTENPKAHLTLLHLRINSFVQASVFRAISTGLPCMSVGARPTCRRLIRSLPSPTKISTLGDFLEWLDHVAVALAHWEWMMRKMMAAEAQKSIDSQDRMY